MPPTANARPADGAPISVTRFVDVAATGTARTPGIAPIFDSTMPVPFPMTVFAPPVSVLPRPAPVERMVSLAADRRPVAMSHTFDKEVADHFEQFDDRRSAAYRPEH